MSKTKNKSVSAKIVILSIIMIVLVVGYYFYLSNKTASAKENPIESKSLTLTEETLLRSLSTDYPPSPKEVVKYYAQITKCFYDGEYNEVQLKELAEKSRELFDDELKGAQTDEEYLVKLKEDIKDFESKGVKISSYSTSSSVDVNYSTTPNGEMASLYCMFNIRQGSTMRSSNNEFILRKDKEGHWKILGWKLKEGSSDA